MKSDKTLFIYTQLQIKKYFRLLPHLILGAIVLLLIAGAVAFCATNISSKNKASNSKAKVAFVLEDNSSLTTMLMELLQDSNCTKSSCEFINTDMNTAKKLVKNGDVTAAIVIPEGFMKSIQDGSNLSVDITFADNSTIIAMILKQLSLAGADTLSCAQAGIYSQYDFYTSHHMYSENADANIYLNKIYLKYVLERENMFHKVKVSPTDTLSTNQYYMCSGILLIILMLPLAYPSFYFELKRNTLNSMLSLKGISFTKRLTIKLLISSLPEWLFLIIAFTIITRSFTFIGFLSLFLAVILGNLLALLIFTISSTAADGMILTFIINFSGCFICGAFIPEVFLPDIITKVSHFLPYSWIFTMIKTLFTA